QLDANGTSAHPIVVKAVNKHKAIITSQITLNGNYGWLYQLKLTAPHAVGIPGKDHNSVTRCWFTRGGGGGISKGGSYNEIGYNRFENTDIFIGTGECYDILLNMRPTDIGVKTPRGNHIFRNYFSSALASTPPANQEPPSVYMGTFVIDGYP